MKNELVEVKSKEIFTNSKILSNKLDVRHQDLLKTIERILERKQGDDQHLVFKQKFINSTFTNKQGRTYPMYLLNEAAFSKLVMNLNGYEKAEIVQDMFIDAFFRMKQALLNHQNISWLDKREQLKETRKDETDIIKDFIDYATAQGSKNAKNYYANITKMTNKALELLIQAPEGKPLRDLATVTELGFIQVVDDRAAKAIQDGMNRKFPYKEIYIYAKEEVNKLVDSLQFRPKLTMENPIVKQESEG
jgi:Rha family phage regulatory protein